MKKNKKNTNEILIDEIIQEILIDEIVPEIINLPLPIIEQAIEIVPIKVRHHVCRKI